MNHYGINEIRVEINPDMLNELLTESIREGFRHIARLVEEYKNGTNRFDQDDEALFLCLTDNRVIGICGLNRDPYFGEGVGRVRRLFVLNEFRGFHIGRKLTEAVIHKSRNYHKRLVLKTDSPNASQFYIKIGFSEVNDNEKMTHYIDLHEIPKC